MTAIEIDRERIRDIFDLRRQAGNEGSDDLPASPYPAFRELRASGPVHRGTPHELLGIDREFGFHGLPEADREHFSVFSWAECDAIYRNEEVFRSAPLGADVVPVDEHTSMRDAILKSSMLVMNGPPHRRYRALVQPSFTPARMTWWIDHWIDETVQSLIDGFVHDGRADLNVEFAALIPVATITSSFGLSIDQALEVRSSLLGLGGRNMVELLRPVIATRREEPQDDLVSVLCQAEVTDDDGTTVRLNDTEILAFSFLLLTAGSGTTWKQMGTTLLALLTTPGALDAVRADRSLVKLAVEESLRWEPTDPAFGRWVARDTEIAGVRIPAESVVHVVLGAANRDPARWERPDEFDITRKLQQSFAFGNGPHICLGMHVARAEMHTAINAVLDRLPNLRLDPDAEPASIFGLYERGPTHVPAIWDPA
jgi:cytochrome P450